MSKIPKVYSLQFQCAPETLKEKRCFWQQNTRNMVFISQESPVISGFIDISFSIKNFYLLQKRSDYKVKYDCQSIVSTPTHKPLSNKNYNNRFWQRKQIRIEYIFPAFAIWMVFKMLYKYEWLQRINFKKWALHHQNIQSIMFTERKKNSTQIKTQLFHLFGYVLTLRMD